MTYGSYMGSWQPSAAGPYTGRRARNSSGAFGLCICTDLDAFYPKTEGLTYGLTDSETDRQPQVGFRSSVPPSVTHIWKAKLRLAVRTILTPAGFPVPHLKAYAPRFSRNMSKMSVLLKLGVPAPSKVT